MLRRSYRLASPSAALLAVPSVVVLLALAGCLYLGLYAAATGIAVALPLFATLAAMHLGGNVSITEYHLHLRCGASAFSVLLADLQGDSITELETPSLRAARAAGVGASNLGGRKVGWFQDSSGARLFLCIQGGPVIAVRTSFGTTIEIQLATIDEHKQLLAHLLCQRDRRLMRGT